jgi:DedD protein
VENRADGRQTAKSGPVPRTDDGRRALALLEGRQDSGRPDAGRQNSMTAPPRAPNPSKGNFVLQIAAYTTQHDAALRRDQLHAAGVTNAYVQEVNLAGKQQYRLRVGPFPSSATAQAAQARLRTLGYDNGFIASQ